MKIIQAFAIVAALLPIACSSGGGGTTTGDVSPGRGSLQLVVDPNPIIATRVSGNTYEFPFEIVLRETGGVAVNVDRVTLNVTALGMNLYSETMDRAEIARRGYPTSLPAGGEIRYRLSPRRDVESDALFSAVSADVVVEATDVNGNSANARTTVTVRRQ